MSQQQQQFTISRWFVKRGPKKKNQAVQIISRNIAIAPVE